MPEDQPGSDGPTPQRSSGFLEDQQSRRLFLKAAVISGAAVAAVGAAGVAAANASPQILRQIRGGPATASGQPVCIELAEASKSGDNPNAFLEVTNDDWDTLMAAGGPNPCILVTDKNDSSHTLLTTVVCVAQKSTTHKLLGICPVQPGTKNDVFPSHSSVCIATGCPPSDTCGTTCS
ncbi:MAG TPA: hypothetical protein VH349_10035 [Ktedonobacterales bacterium]|jgi:hypothetical protein